MNLFDALASPQIGMDHIALNGSRTHDGNLNHQIIEFSGLQTWQHVHLGAAFHLKHPEGIGLTQHVVNLGIVLLDGCKLIVFAAMLMDQIEGLADAGQHTE